MERGSRHGGVFVCIARRYERLLVWEMGLGCILLMQLNWIGEETHVLVCFQMRDLVLAHWFNTWTCSISVRVKSNREDEAEAFMIKYATVANQRIH